MFDAMIITPGGPGAEKEARRFDRYSNLYLFSNSASESGSPEWFSALSATQSFDLKDLQVGSAAEALLKKPALMKVGYIGSPGNLKDANVKKVIVELLSKLTKSAEIYVGPPNKDLKEAVAGVKFQDMTQAAVDMFDAMIITPGGPGAEKEARRFDRYSNLYLFSNSASESGSPEWFSALSATQSFDLKDLQVGSAAEALLKGVDADRSVVETTVPMAPMEPMVPMVAASSSATPGGCLSFLACFLWPPAATRAA